MNFLLSFGDYLKKIRKEVMTQRELASRIGVGHPYISKLENNIESTPSDEILISIAKVLNINVDDVFVQARKIPQDLRELIIDKPQIIQILRFIQQDHNLIDKLSHGRVVTGDFYRQIFHENRRCMLLIDPDTAGIINANASATKFYQYPMKRITNMMITDINILSEEEIFQEMQKAKLEARNHFIFKHRLRNDEIKKVQVFSDPITIDGKTYLHSIINEV